MIIIRSKNFSKINAHPRFDIQLPGGGVDRNGNGYLDGIGKSIIENIYNALRNSFSGNTLTEEICKELWSLGNNKFNMSELEAKAREYIRLLMRR